MNFAHRTHVRDPIAPDAPFSYVPGPIYNNGAETMIFDTDLLKPPQRIFGGGYPVSMQFESVYQPPPLFAPKAVTSDSLGGPMAGQYIIPWLTEDDGSWPNGGGLQ